MSDYLLPERKARIDEVVSRRTRTLSVVIEALCDPQNVNAVLRTCDAFGIQDVHVVEGPMKGFDRNKKISQNADKWLDVTRWTSTREWRLALYRDLRATGRAPTNEEVRGGPVFTNSLQRGKGLKEAELALSIEGGRAGSLY